MALAGPGWQLWLAFGASGSRWLCFWLALAYFWLTLAVSDWLWLALWLDLAISA